MWNNLPVALAATTPYQSWFLVACAAGTVALLLILITWARLHPALALCIAAFTLGVASGMPLKEVPLSFTAGVGNLMGHIAIVLGLGAVLGRLLASSGGAFELIAGVLVILAAAGGLSGILRDSGAAQATVSLTLGARMPPLVLAWLLAAVVRISMGSATVAMAVASGVLAPMAGHIGVRPELLVLATGTGSLILSHVNDPGFWMIQSFFKLELKQTLTTWMVLETVLSVAGLGMTLLLATALRSVKIRWFLSNCL